MYVCITSSYSVLKEWRFHYVCIHAFFVVYNLVTKCEPHWWRRVRSHVN